MNNIILRMTSYYVLFEKKIKDTIAYSKTVLAKEASSQHTSGPCCVRH